MEHLLEAIMVICFGISWPLSISKSYKSKTTKGKSLLFMCFIEFGYLSGIVWKMLVFSTTGILTYPTYFYYLNFIMVGIDIALYFRNKKFDKAALAK